MTTGAREVIHVQGVAACSRQRRVLWQACWQLLQRVGGAWEAGVGQLGWGARRGESRAVQACGACCSCQAEAPRRTFKGHLEMKNEGSITRSGAKSDVQKLLRNCSDREVYPLGPRPVTRGNIV
jgi:hypothetical protein